MTGRFGSHITNGIAALRSDRSYSVAKELNRQFQQDAINAVARQVHIHGAAVVAEIATRFPAIFADHHYTEETPQ